MQTASGHQYRMGPRSSLVGNVAGLVQCLCSPCPAATAAPLNHPDDELVSCIARHLSYHIMQATGASQVALAVRNLPANTGDVTDEGSIPGSGRSLEEEIAAHSSILAWEIPWSEKPGRP